jgi:hypothetical protein
MQFGSLHRAAWLAVMERMACQLVRCDNILVYVPAEAVQSCSHSHALQCTACWAFAAIASLESKYAISKGQLLDLSEQQALDCSGPKSGCSGGFSTDVFRYAQRKGITTDAVYGAYRGTKQACNEAALVRAPASQKVRILTAPGYKDIPPNSATELMKVGSPDWGTQSMQVSSFTAVDPWL